MVVEMFVISLVHRFILSSHLLVSSCHFLSNIWRSQIEIYVPQNYKGKSLKQALVFKRTSKVEQAKCFYIMNCISSIVSEVLSVPLFQYYPIFSKTKV